MIHLIFSIIQDQDHVDDLIRQWEINGAFATSLIPASTISQDFRTSLLNEDFPIIPSIERILETPLQPSTFLVAFASSKEIAEKILVITRSFPFPDVNPIVAIIPVSMSLGLPLEK